MKNGIVLLLERRALERKKKRSIKRAASHAVDKFFDKWRNEEGKKTYKFRAEEFDQEFGINSNSLHGREDVIKELRRRFFKVQKLCAGLKITRYENAAYVSASIKEYEISLPQIPGFKKYID